MSVGTNVLRLLVVFGLALCLQPTGLAAPKGKAAAPLPAPRISVTAKGFMVKPCIAGQCRNGRLVIPKRGDYDFAALRLAMVRLRARYARLPGLTVTGSHSTGWNTMVQTIAHARTKADGKPLFPVVFLALGGR